MGLVQPEFVRRFDRELEAQKKTLMLFIVPLFACAVALLHLRGDRRYAEHLVFSIHSFAFLRFLLLALGTLGFRLAVWVARPLGASPATLRWLGSEGPLTFVLGAGMVTYLTRAERHYYRSSWPVAAVRATALFFVLGFLVVAYRNVLFTTTLALL